MRLVEQEEVVSLEFERVDRIPTRRSASHTLKSQELSSSRRASTNIRIVQYVKNIENTKIGVADDFPKEIDKIRKDHLPMLKKR